MNKREQIRVLKKRIRSLEKIKRGCKKIMDGCNDICRVYSTELGDPLSHEVIKRMRALSDGYDTVTRESDVTICEIRMQIDDIQKEGNDGLRNI